MPASTVGQLRSILSTYVEEGTPFLMALNQVLARMHTMGTYKDLTIQFNLPVVEGCITLPDDADSILHVLVETEPRPVRDLWHDFIQANVNQTDQTWGLIDAGFHPVKLDDLDPNDTGTLTDIFIVPSPQSHLTTPFDTTADYAAKLVVDGTDGDQVYRGTVTLSGSDPIVQFSSPIDRITKITFGDLPALFDLRTSKDDDTTDVARIGPETGTTRYRRFRVSGSTDGETSVVILAKRLFRPLHFDTDVVVLGNVNAVKHGLLGRVAEDSADLERAEYHWETCRSLLEEELASSRGAAIPTMVFDPYGGNPPVPALL